MAALKCFKMPTPMKILGRKSSITNAYVNGIIPVVYPTEEEVLESLEILQLDAENLRCAYCGDIATEWDHLRPLIENQKPTGYISEIANLVPACGKCNQSKGNKNWHKWMLSNAPLSPKSREIRDLDDRIERLKAYERWRKVERLDFRQMVGHEEWDAYWQSLDDVIDSMSQGQALAESIRERIATAYKSM